MNHIGELLYLVLPVVVAGILNMVFVKAPFLESLKIPMDKGRKLNDGNRLFGENKTWKGFLGMIVLTAFVMLFFQWLALSFEWANSVSLFPYRDWQFPLEGAFYGSIMGLAYVLAELPNSYIKRRIDISPGTNASGLKGKVFLIVDQADSVFGCVLFMPIFYVPSILDAVTIVVLATCLHLLVNFLLYLVGLKNQPA